MFLCLTLPYCTSLCWVAAALGSEFLPPLAPCGGESKKPCGPGTMTWRSIAYCSRGEETTLHSLEELTAVETSLRAELLAEGTKSFMLDRMVQVRRDNLLAGRAGVLSYTEWRVKHS